MRFQQRQRKAGPKEPGKRTEKNNGDATQGNNFHM